MSIASLGHARRSAGLQLTPADVIVYRDGDYAVAVETQTRQIIARSTEHATVIQSTINHLTSGGKIYIAKGEYVINPTYRDTNWYVGLIMKNRISLVGAGAGKTILKFTDEGASGRVDGISFDSGDIYDVEIKDMTIDGSLIDWSSIGYGDGIRPVNPTNTVNNALLENLEIKNWNVGWGIGWGYTSSVGERLTIRNIWGENLGRGVVWVSNQNYCRIENIYGKNIIGYSVTGEGDIVVIESGVYHSIDGIYGVDVPDALIALFGTIRTNVSNVQGTTQKYGIRLGNVNHVNISNVKIDGDPSKTVGLYWSVSGTSGHVSVTNANLENHQYGIYVEGTSTYYAYHLEFRGRILSWNASQLSAIYARYLDNALIELSELSWGYGSIADIDYTKETTIRIHRQASGGTYTITKGTNVETTKIAILNGSKLSINSGKATFSGDGTTTQFAIAHGLVSTPSKVVVTPASADASGSFYVTVDATNIYVNYSTAPPSGTDNVVLYWWAEV